MMRCFGYFQPAFGGTGSNLFGTTTNTSSGGLFGGASKPFGTATTSTGFGGFGTGFGTSLFGGQQKVHHDFHSVLNKSAEM